MTRATDKLLLPLPIHFLRQQDKTSLALRRGEQTWCEPLTWHVKHPWRWKRSRKYTHVSYTTPQSKFATSRVHLCKLHPKLCVLLIPKHDFYCSISFLFSWSPHRSLHGSQTAIKSSVSPYISIDPGYWISTAKFPLSAERHLLKKGLIPPYPPGFIFRELN